MQSVLVFTNGVSIQLNGVIFIKHQITVTVTSLYRGLKTLQRKHFSLLMNCRHLEAMMSEENLKEQSCGSDQLLYGVRAPP